MSLLSPDLRFLFNEGDLYWVTEPIPTASVISSEPTPPVVETLPVAELPAIAANPPPPAPPSARVAPPLAKSAETVPEAESVKAASTPPPSVRPVPATWLVVKQAPDAEDKELLAKMLRAVGLAPRDVALLNLADDPAGVAQLAHPALRRALLFGVSAAEAGLPDAPWYTPLTHGSNALLYARALPLLRASNADKRLLWEALQRMFNYPKSVER